MTLSIQENVIGLDITMDDALAVEVSESLACLSCTSASSVHHQRIDVTHLKADTRDLILLQGIVFNNVRQSTSLHVLHNNPKLVTPDQVSVKEVDDIRMLGLFHDKNLIHDKFLPWLVRQIHFLDSDLLARRECLGNVDMSGSTVKPNISYPFCQSARTLELWVNPLTLVQLSESCYTSTLDHQH